MMNRRRQNPGDKPSDEKLLACLAGEDGVDNYFMELYNAYHMRLSSFVSKVLYRRSYETSNVEDIVQETMINAYRALKGYSSERIRNLSLSAWLYRIALNEARYYMNRRPFYMTSYPTADSGTEEYFKNLKDDFYYGNTPESIIEDKEALETILKAIYNLPLLYREVGVLRWLEDLSYNELIQRTGRPENTIKSQISRARILLRGSLQQS